MPQHHEDNVSPKERIASSTESATTFMGPVLRSEKRKHLGALTIVLLSMTAGIAVVAAACFLTKDVTVFAIIGAGIFVCGTAYAINTAKSGVSGTQIFRVHQNGVSFERGGTITRMAYEQIDTLSYSLSDVYVNGTYHGYVHALELASNSGTAYSSAIRFQTDRSVLQVKELVSRIAEEISLKMADDLRDNTKLAWGKDAWIFKKGIEVPVQSKLLKSNQFFAWHEIHDLKMEDNRLHIAVGDSKKWRIKLDCAGPNFLPGFSIVKALVATSGLSPSWDEPADADALVEA